MKRISAGKMITLLLAIVLLVSLVGCAPPQSGDEETLNLNLIGATLGGGGVWDLIAAGIAETITQKLPGSIITSVPGEGVANVMSVHNGEAELGLTHSSVAAAAFRGIDPYSEEITDIRAITGLYGSGLQFIARKELPVASLREMIDRKYKIRLAVGAPGSTGELATSRMLQEYGATYAAIEEWGGKIYYKDMSEAADMLGDGLIDAFTLLTIAPAGPVREVSSSHAVKMLPIAPEINAAMVEKYGYMEFAIARDAYAFLDSDIPTFGSQVIIITGDRMPEMDAYRITKALVENLEYLHTVHSNLKDLTPEKMASGTGVDLHPGAAKYYREVGALE
ncbi:MAG: TAXI family TRAP transporter solute-binding subunit [bacterium]|jgi:TRAP transporter TAXI family solute receptor